MKQKLTIGICAIVMTACLSGCGELEEAVLREVERAVVAEMGEAATTDEEHRRNSCRI